MLKMQNENKDQRLLRKIQGIYFFITALTIVIFLQSVPSLSNYPPIKYLTYFILTITFLGIIITIIDINKLKEQFFIIFIKKKRNQKNG